jgi:hypothetical protein
MVDRLRLSRAILFVQLATWLWVLTIMLAMFVDIVTCDLNSVGSRVAPIVFVLIYLGANAYAARGLFACAPFRSVLLGNAVMDPGADALLRSVRAVGVERCFFFSPLQLRSHSLFLVFSATAGCLYSSGRTLNACTDMSRVFWLAFSVRYGCLLAHLIWVAREAVLLDDVTHGAVSATVRRQWRADDAELQFPQSFVRELIDAAQCKALLCAEFCPGSEPPVPEPAPSLDEAREQLMPNASLMHTSRSELGAPETEAQAAAADELCTLWGLRQLTDLRFLRSFPRFSWPSFAGRVLDHLRSSAVFGTAANLFHSLYNQPVVPKQSASQEVRRTALSYAWSLAAMFLIRLLLGVWFLVSSVLVCLCPRREFISLCCGSGFVQWALADSQRIVLLLLLLVPALVAAGFLVPCEVEASREEGLSPIRPLKDLWLFLGGSDAPAFTSYQVSVYLVHYSSLLGSLWPQVWRVLTSALHGWFIEAIVEYFAVLGHFGVDPSLRPFQIVCFPSLLVLLCYSRSFAPFSFASAAGLPGSHDLSRIGSADPAQVLPMPLSGNGTRISASAIAVSHAWTVGSVGGQGLRLLLDCKRQAQRHQ